MWTPEEEQHFLHEMAANPGQAEPALRFADWLESVGKPAHAELIRLHHNPSTNAWKEWMTQGYANEAPYPGGIHVQVTPDGLQAVSPLVRVLKTKVVKRFKVVGKPPLSHITFGVEIPEKQAIALHKAVQEEGGV